MKTNRISNSDAILKRYEKERRNIVEEIFNADHGKISEIIARSVQIDNYCRRSMGSGEYRSPYSCSKCSEISEITSMRCGEIKSFDIEAGARNGENIVVLRDENPIVKVEKDEKAFSRYKQLEIMTGLCNPPKTKVKQFVAVTNWLNGILMNYIVEQILKNTGIPHCLAIEIGFQCNRVGYSLRPYFRKITDFKDSIIEKDVCRTILQQIAITLHALSKYSFIHGSATIDRLFIDDTVDCNYRYDKYSIIGDFTVLISNYQYSSLTVNETRIFPHPLGRHVNIESSLNNFVPVVERRNITEYDISDDSVVTSGDTIFKVVCGASELFTTMRYSGYPLFGGAYDMYSFLISLMSWRPFNEGIRRDTELSKIWTDLFPEKHYIPIVPTESLITCSYQIADILKGHWLYCDVINRLLYNLESLIEFD